MTENIVCQLKEWAEKYHRTAFIESDPIQFPHRYKQKQDIEISGLLTSIMSFGNRIQIIRKANVLHDTMGDSPHAYVLSGRWDEDFPSFRTDSFYRMLSFADFNRLFGKLYYAYTSFDSLEDALLALTGTPMERICAFLGVSAKSPQKKLNMFLRWMVRQDSEVDFGIWKHFDSRDLLIPLDTHVCHVAFLLGLTDSETFSLKNARLITEALSEVFPGDPCLGDFALFGYGVNHKQSAKIISPK